MVIHPIVLHFPVALLVTGTLAFLWTSLRQNSAGKKPVFRVALEGFVNGTLVLGYAGLLISLATGLFDMQASPKALAREGWIIIAVLHIISAVSLLLVYGCFLYRRFLVLPSELTLPANPASSGSSTSDLSTESGKLSTKVIEPETLPVATIVTLDKLSIVLAALGLVLLIIAGWLGGTLVYDYRVGLS